MALLRAIWPLKVRDSGAVAGMIHHLHSFAAASLPKVECHRFSTLTNCHIPVHAPRIRSDPFPVLTLPLKSTCS